MGRVFLSSLSIYLLAFAGLAQSGDRAQSDNRAQPDNRTVLGEVNEFLAAGAEAIRAGRYDDGIRLTSIGLADYPSTPYERAAGLANLCAAHAASGNPDLAIERCNESIALNARNWRAYSNRSYAYFLKGMYSEATLDIDVAAAMAPEADQVQQIRGMINERSLRPRVTMEDRQ